MLKKISAPGEKRHLQYPEGTVDGAGKTCGEVFGNCTYLEDVGENWIIFPSSLVLLVLGKKFLSSPPN